ncbi:hypothetical protein M422DRAFT_274111 [Sphaerobolus stellatus SS14]|uniref:Uncharacterized protein n=1 Tax=Sphaerobolus stellatus (strain SS14) TaxID=990650 RepID=A0A0C9UIH2_SPHS4|nr:hypothetical protein M422DRAFT_274111 [Sphaerobolus stellatus SS14]
MITTPLQPLAPQQATPAPIAFCVLLMNPTSSTPHPTQPQSYVDAVAGSAPIPSSPTHSISRMDYIDSDDQSPMEDVMALTDESQVHNNLPTQPTNSNKHRAKEDLPVAEPHVKTSLPNFKKKKISTDLGTAGGQSSAHIPNAGSTVNAQGTGMQPPQRQHRFHRPLCAERTNPPPLLNVPNALSETLTGFPDDGPKIHGLEVSKLYTRTHQESRTIFQSHPGEKMVFYPPGKELGNPTPLVLEVRQFFQELFPHNQLGTLIIGTPHIVKLDDKCDFKAPFPIFVGNLTLQEKQLLFSCPVWVTPSLTLFAQEFLPPPSSFSPKAAYKENVRAVIHDKIKFSTAFSGFIRKYHDNIPPPPNVNDNVSIHVVNYVLNSINVKLLKIIENGLNVALFNVYVHPPSKILKHHTKWLALLRGNVYTMTEGASSPLKVPYNCSVCRGEDHPTGLCAFTKLPGWIDCSQVAATNWPIKKGNGSLKLKKKPTFKQLVNNLLDDNLGMKVALPLPSPTVQAEVASLYTSGGVDALKTHYVPINKSKTAATRTLSGQKDDMDLGIDPAAGGIPKPALSAVTDLTPALGIALPSLQTVDPITIPPQDPAGAMEPSGAARMIATISPTSLTPPTAPAPPHDPTDPTILSPPSSGAMEPNNSIDISADVQMTTLDGSGNEEGISIENGAQDAATTPAAEPTPNMSRGSSPVAQHAEIISMGMDTMSTDDGVLLLLDSDGKIYSGTMQAQVPIAMFPTNEAWQMEVGLDQNPMNIARLLRLIISDQRVAVSNDKEVVRLFVCQSQLQDPLKQDSWRLDTAELIGCLQGTGSALRSFGWAYKIQMPSHEKEDCWEVLIVVEPGQDPKDTHCVLNNIIVKEDDARISRLQVRLQPGNPHKHIREQESDVGPSEKKVRLSMSPEPPQANEEVTRVKPTPLKTANDRAQKAQKVFDDNMKRKRQNMINYLEDKMRQNAGYEEFIALNKGTRLTNPQIVKQARFVFQMHNTYAKTKDLNRNTITSEMLAQALQYSPSRMNDFLNIHQHAFKLGRNGQKEIDEVVEQLEYVPEEGEVPGGSVALLKFLKTFDYSTMEPDECQLKSMGHSL